ncbi:MAG: hypothetical protein BMS9Abin28_0804 [Anaerolineae bacterium]|nr:MAG: hypothetical protein BMS9Abin28_0804 [Anaerolineae bacterium]
MPEGLGDLAEVSPAKQGSTYFLPLLRSRTHN